MKVQHLIGTWLMETGLITELVCYQALDEAIPYVDSTIWLNVKLHHQQEELEWSQ